MYVGVGLYEYKTKDTRRHISTYMYINQHYNFSNFCYRMSRLAFLANALSRPTSSGVRTTVLAVALQQEKRIESTDRRQRSLQLGEDAVRLARRYEQRSYRMVSSR